MAEYFRDDEHRDVLLLVDNIFRFIQPGMDVSGLPGQMPSLLGYQPTMGTELPGWGRAYCNTDIGPSRPFGQCKCRLTIQPIRFGREVAAKAVRIDSVMVEAGGVEPPSEKARNEETTCVAGSEISATASESGERGGGLVRLGFSRRLRTEAIGQSRKMTLTHRRAGSAAGAAT